MTKKAAKKKSAKRVLKYKFTNPKTVGYFNPDDLKPKKKHYATKLKEERNDLERKLFHLYRMWKGDRSTDADKLLLDWLKNNEKVNRMTVSRRTVRVTENPTGESKIKWAK